MNSIQRGMTLLGVTTVLVGGILLKPLTADAEPTENVQPLETIAQQSAEDFFKQAFDKYKKGDYRGTIEDLNQAIRINPNEAKFYYSRGLTRRKLSDSQTAITDYTLAVQTDPNYADAYYNRGNAYCTVGDRPEAIKDYQQAANLYLKQGKLEDSQEALARARGILQQLNATNSKQPC